ncbi:hypothetical protein ABZ016_14280 [Streptomyces sp. NPDC006372]|uniref:hypothetical protein n=1 Tax=Streptomyces sp. NPDC006372 TaxID=3155599 RepID=UPI0033A82AFF
MTTTAGNHPAAAYPAPPGPSAPTGDAGPGPVPGPHGARRRDARERPGPSGWAAPGPGCAWSGSG